MAWGRQLGVVVQRTPHGGTLAIQVAGRTREYDLYVPRSVTSVIETDLPGRAVPVPVTVRLLGRRNPAAEGGTARIAGVYTSTVRAAEVPARLAERVALETAGGPALCQLTDVFKWYDPEWRATMDDLAVCPPYEPPDFIHRKAWEWVHTIYGLDRLGMILPEHRALGVGVGWEPLSYFLANRVAAVVATDLYPVDDMWSTQGAQEGDPKILEDPDEFAPYEYRKDRIRFLRMDGKQLEFPDASFDFVWSCSSIEHFGRHAGAAQAMREIARVLRPGGVAAVITEFVLPEPGPFTTFDNEYFNLRCVLDYLVGPVPELRLVEPLDVTVPRYYVDRAVVCPEEGAAPHGIDKPHIVLRSESGCLVTSMALFFRKAAGDGAGAQWAAS